MKRLNEEATSIFCRLLEILGSRDYILLFSSIVKPLSIKKITEFVSEPKGKVTLFSLTQHKEAGDTFLRDPEIRFMVIDGRSGEDRNGILIYPQFIAKDSHQLERELISIDASGVVIDYDKRRQSDVCKLAEDWLSILKKEGFLK